MQQQGGLTTTMFTPNSCFAASVHALMNLLSTTRCCRLSPLMQPRKRWPNLLFPCTRRVLLEGSSEISLLLRDPEVLSWLCNNGEASDRLSRSLATGTDSPQCWQAAAEFA